MKQKRQTILIPKEIADQIQKDLHETENFDDILNRYNRYESSSWTAKFEDDIEIDVKICCGDTREDDSNPLWTEAVLFQNGSEVCFTEPDYDLIGDWILEAFDTEYIVSVKTDEMHLPNTQLNIFFDMDNVLNQLDNEDDIPWDKRRIQSFGHYFLHCTANTQMQQFIQAMACMNNQLYTLGHIRAQNRELACENLYDKIQWMNTNFPNFDNKHLIWVPEEVPKANAVSVIFDRPLTKTDILLDDYNPNLIYWRNAGGTAIKYINENNSITSWDGAYITSDMSVIDIRKYLLNAVYGTNSVTKTNTENLTTTRTIVLQDEDGSITDLLLVKNHNEHFAEKLETAIDNWYHTDEEFSNFVYKQLQNYGYKIEVLKNWESAASYV